MQRKLYSLPIQKMKYALAFLLLLTGCAGEKDPVQQRQFKLDDGYIAECRWAKENPCGYTLWDCKDGGYYTCEQNVTIVTN